MPEDTKLASEHWSPDFEAACFRLLDYVLKFDGGRYVSCAEGAFERIKLRYRKMVNAYKRSIANGRLIKIDHHKMIAFYILAILAEKPFYFNPPNTADKHKRSWLAMLPNEYYCIYLIELILLAWNNEAEKRVRFPDRTYTQSLIVLFHRIFVSKTEYDAIPLAHIIYFIEKYCLKTPQ